MAGYVLYGYPGSGSAAVEAAMTDAGIPFEFHDVDRRGGELVSATFTKINPRQQVPALVTPGGDVVTEMPAILNHLADAHPESRLAPPPGSRERAQADRWLAFLHANLYEGILRIYYAERYTTDPQGAAGVKAAAEAYVARMFAIFDGVLGEGPFFGGEAPSAVDFLAWMLASWVPREPLVAECPRLARLIAAVEAREGLGDAVARNL